MIEFHYSSLLELLIQLDTEVIGNHSFFLK